MFQRLAAVAHLHGPSLACSHLARQGSKAASSLPSSSASMPASASDVALQLVQRRVDGNPCADAKQLRVIPTREVALEVQQAMIKIAASGAVTGPVFPAGLGKHVGWKIGGWPTAGVLGPLFENVVLPSPATASLAEQNMGTLEAELGFVLKAGLPPREAP